MTKTNFNRLVLVSNRLPFSLVEKDGHLSLRQSDGGLVSALKGYFEGSKGKFQFTEKLWVGSADFPEKRWLAFSKGSRQDVAFRIEPIFIEPKTYDRYYNGFSNATLWPMFHYFPGNAIFDEVSFDSYREVNALFAERLHAVLEPGDVVWVQDYQLMLLPRMIREMRSDVSIGFFLHIPFPSYEIFRMLHKPWQEKLIDGLLGADLIGFHTHQYVEHFLKSVRIVKGLNHHYRTIAFEDRIAKVDLFPLGIDYDLFSGATADPHIREQKERIEAHFQDRKVIFSVDRLDYTKGLTHRLAAYETFLAEYPEWRGKVVFVLVVVPSREIISKYNERKEEIEQMVGRINGKYSSMQWQPLIYRYRRLSFEELSANYQAADVALITPLRDGMNLVAKEFVASSDDGRGVLILSELAGAANDLGEATTINPLDTGAIARAIADSLELPEDEQARRMGLMRDRIRTYDVTHWVNYYLGQLNEVQGQKEGRMRKFLKGKTEENLLRAFQNARRRLIFLDYDGTLVPFARLPGEASPQEGLQRLLRELCSQDGNEVVIISGRDSAILTTWFAGLDVNLVAEHGASVRLHGETDWKHAPMSDQSWKANIRPTLELFVERIPNSFVEEKSHTIAWHYRNVDVDFGFKRSRELLDILFHLVRNAELQVIDGNRVIEIRVAGIDKGNAARNLVQHFRPDFVMAIGDDKTDEDMFVALAEEAFTIKVGSGVTEAQFVVPTQGHVIPLLERMARAHD